jgi:hypothetical protein
VEVGPAVLKRVPLDGQVQIDVAGATLAEFGEFLDRHCEVELLIPASDASRKIEVSEEYITVRALIDRTGLVMADQGHPKPERRVASSSRARGRPGGGTHSRPGA